MTYTDPQNIWRNLGKDSYTKVRGEVLGTGNGVVSAWNTEHDNLITSSLILYTGGNAITGNYTTDLDAGSISALTASSGSVLTADYDYGDLPNSVITTIIQESDALTEALTNRVFTATTGSVEYLDVEEGRSTFWLSNYPVITLSAVESNTKELTQPPVWAVAEAGLGYDYLANSQDLAIGRIRFINNFPYIGEDRLRVTYDYGYSTTPPLVKELSTLIAIRNMANSAVYKAIFKGQDNFTPVRLAEIENRIQELVRILKKEGTDVV